MSSGEDIVVTQVTSIMQDSKVVLKKMPLTTVAHSCLTTLLEPESPSVGDVIPQLLFSAKLRRASSSTAFQGRTGF